MDISVRNLSKTYGHQKAVDSISFDVKTGDIVGFLGPNGAGKTTTMKMITGYMDIEQGDIRFANQSISGEKDFRSHIGYLPEHNPLYLDMQVIDYLKFCASLQAVAPHQLQDSVIKMVKLCGLNREKHKKIGELSKGYRQRVGLAQAIIHDPEILILDEPTTGLDPNQIVEIRELIKEIGKRKTVILCTHILPEVEATCDRILIINNGKIVADGTPEILRKQAEGQERLHLTIEDADRDTVFKALKGLTSVASVDFQQQGSNNFEVLGIAGQSARRAIFELCVKNHWVLSRLSPQEARLEDVFRNLTVN